MTSLVTTFPQCRNLVLTPTPQPHPFTRFPSDFMFRLSRAEWKRLQGLRSQIAILKPGRGQHRKHLPYAFTEHGAVMAANILNSPKAVQMSVFVVRAFLKMRSMFGKDQDLDRKLAQLEDELRARLNIHESAIVGVLQRIMKILDPPPPPPEPPRPQIGFHAAVTADRKAFNAKALTKVSDL